MPILRNVAKTDLLESQRVKINLLAQDVFDLGGGGSSGNFAGTIALNNGTRFVPSLYFTNQSKTGLFLNANALSITSFESEAARFDSAGINIYKSFSLQSTTIDTVNITSAGLRNYSGAYQNLPVAGGSGTGALFDGVVVPFTGTITNAGTGYRGGTYTNILLTGGTGSSCLATVTVRGLEGTITNAGSGYVSLVYPDVPLSGGSGTGAIATITVNGGVVSDVTITNSGSGYVNGDVLFVVNANLVIPPSQGGGTSPGSGFTFTKNAAPYVVTTVTPTSSGFGGYTVGDVLSAANTKIGGSTPVGTITNPGIGYIDSTYTNVPVFNNPTTTYIVTTVNNPGTPPPNHVFAIDGVTQQSLSLIRGNTYRFDLSDTSNITHPFVLLGAGYGPLPTGITVNTVGTSGQPGAFVELVISNTAATGANALIYSCAAHPGMGANISLISGTAGRYGFGAKATVTVTSGEVTSFVITDVGNSYKANDTLVLSTTNLGGSGVGFLYTINTASTGSGSGFAYTLSSVGSLASTVVRSNGLGYQKDDVLTLAVPVKFLIKNFGTYNNFQYYIDQQNGAGYTVRPTLTLYRGFTYVFDYSDSSNLPHGFNISTTPDGIHNTPPGVPYSSGVTIDTQALTLTIVVSASTPDTLYYYCPNILASHVGEGGTINVVSTSPTYYTAPKLTITGVTPSNKISLGLNGAITGLSFTGSSTITDSVTATTNANIGSISLNGNTISTASGVLNLSAGSDLTILGGTYKYVLVNNGATNTVTLDTLSGNIDTQGNISITTPPGAVLNNYLSVNNKLKIESTSIQEIVDVPLTGNGVGINITPDSNKSVAIVATSSLRIPSGTTLQRPADQAAGSIRFNSSTSSYEGYNGTTWTSLGGTKDVDGNTYIIAESSPGANENILYFYNNAAETVRVKEFEFAFLNANTLAVYDVQGLLDWKANTSFAINAQVFTNNNVYRVVTAGTTGAVAPTHTSGSQSNGSAILLWLRSSNGPLNISNRVSQLNIFTPTYFNGADIKIDNNVISTDIHDLTLTPFAGKKVTISATTSLTLPYGSVAQRGSPSIGSIRYNTDFVAFEGYNGTNWTSLGGVKDVDGNTYIIPESSPGANENILYFYNNGVNTLRVSTTELTFNTIDQIGSTNNNLDLQAQTVTYNNLALTIDTSAASDSKLLSTKTNFDVAISSGIYNDTLLRLNSSGDILVNKTYGTGVSTYIKVLENELKSLELDDVKLETLETTLVKGTNNSGAFIIYDPTLYSAAKVMLIASNVTTNDKEIIEFNVTSKSTDIFHNEFGNVTSGVDQVSVTFDFDASGNVRLTSTLTASVSTSNNVLVTCYKTLIKK